MSSAESPSSSSSNLPAKNVEIYVPTGPYSLMNDAPGWRPNNIAATSSANVKKNNGGPICWKCKGTAKAKKKKTISPCNVCSGKGYLPPKKKEIDSLSIAGIITPIRKHDAGWESTGPAPIALSSSDIEDRDDLKQAINLLQTANTGVRVPVPATISSNAVPWLPRNGEELCNLVGSWRILQRVGSHRWTTDDLVTAYVASKEAENAVNDDVPSETSDDAAFRYLDLGCGNGSVLQMTSWGLLEKRRFGRGGLSCVGVEAREEAVDLARRSLSFNLGSVADSTNSSGAVNARVVHGDFRSVFPPVKAEDDGVNNTSSEGKDDPNAKNAQQKAFDLVTGTPPYFRVHFTVASSEESKDMFVKKAVIHEGGMPTCLQSAPARCEFRGGIEAYCEAASRAMKPNGLFVVCENWINHDRVLDGARNAGLVIVRVLPVKGKVTKPCPLFAVYTMRNLAHSTSDTIATTTTMDIAPALSVRDEFGSWTEEYRNVLKYMSIPTLK